ncbi:MAG: type II toxin-antitoxin system CcdA family antitoxin, partial [Candidatus Bathyarchaeota archaeon]|nr:type II toxin-antitoxin system CcdA family antitoxin [Candidatus Bathyarchaeota archaeon]
MKVKQRKKTVGITLPLDLVKRAGKHKLNISRISEQALLSVLDYLETQNRETSHSEGISTAVRLSHQQGGAGNGILSP